MGGFYTVLQVFVLEVFLGLAEYCAKKEGSLWPRMHNWKVSKGGYYTSFLVIKGCVFFFFLER